MTEVNVEKAKVAVVCITLPTANDFVNKTHRHHSAIPAGFVWFCSGAIVNEKLVAVAICGRPTNRNNDDGQTVELLRLASDGTANCPSALMGACAKAAQAMGARRIITYTLESESGASLRGAGYVLEKKGIKSCWMKGTSRRTAVDRPHMDEAKVRWCKHFREPILYKYDREQTTTTVAKHSIFDFLEP